MRVRTIFLGSSFYPPHHIAVSSNWEHSAMFLSERIRDNGNLDKKASGGGPGKWDGFVGTIISVS